MIKLAGERLFTFGSNPIKMNSRFLLCLILFAIAVSSSCTKDFLEDGLPHEIIGEWKLTYFLDDCGNNMSWPECSTTIVPSETYTLKIKGNGRIRSYKGNEQIWCNKIVELNDFSPPVEGRRYGTFKEATNSGNTFVMYFNEDGSIGFNSFPNPLLEEGVDDAFWAHFAVYKPKQ